MVFPLLLSLIGSVITFLILAKFDIVRLLIPLGLMILGVLKTYQRYINSYNLFYNEKHLVLKKKKDREKLF